VSAVGTLSKSQQGGLTDDHNPEDAKEYTDNNGAQSKDKTASPESKEFEGTNIGDKKTDGGGAAPVGESNESGIYTKKNPGPGWKD
jgi:hypothetical protein